MVRVLSSHRVAEPDTLPDAVVLVVLGLLVRVVPAAGAVVIGELADLLQQEPVGVGEDTLERDGGVGPAHDHALKAFERLVRLAVGILHGGATDAVLGDRRDTPAEQLFTRGVDPSVHVRGEERLGIELAVGGGAVDAGVRVLAAAPVVEPALHVLVHVLVRDIGGDRGFLQLAEGVDEVDGLGAGRRGGGMRGEHLGDAARGFGAVDAGRERGEPDAHGEDTGVLDDVVGANLAA
mmetsp:Transcript_9372/g.42705  ORF Transcript_9372/g.42705 Transcript_9372/m.42705 type:complete len:236 (+) Transcript_9372:1595-2302(+)